MSISNITGDKRLNNKILVFLYFNFNYIQVKL